MVQPRRIPWTDTVDPAREEHLELVMRDPLAARRQRLEKRVRYWRKRVEHLQARLVELRELMADAELEAGAPAIDLWRGQVEAQLAMTDVLEATNRLAEAEREARAAGAKIEPFGWQPAPAPAILPHAGPRRRGPRITCECGTCSRCKARESMRRLRAQRKARAARGR